MNVCTYVCMYVHTYVSHIVSFAGLINASRCFCAVVAGRQVHPSWGALVGASGNAAARGARPPARERRPPPSSGPTPLFRDPPPRIRRAASSSRTRVSSSVLVPLCGKRCPPLLGAFPGPSCARKARFKGTKVQTRSKVQRFKGTKVHGYVYTCIHTYIRTYVRTYVRTYIHTYRHTGIQAYIRGADAHAPLVYLDKPLV